MSEPLGWDDVCQWLELRKWNLCKAWSKKFAEIIGEGESSWSLEVGLRLDDAADKQARIERFACLYGRPVPSADEAIAELIAWLKNGQFSERADTANLLMKQRVGEEITEDERKAFREAWRRRLAT
jgi:hypothetical protein